jgi:hypothetical protein
MRIAVIFSGKIDSFEKNYDNILKYIVKDNEVDYFLSISPELNSDLEGFKKLYKPKILNNDKIKYFNCSKYQHINFHDKMCQYVNRYRIAKVLIKYAYSNNIIYDLVISYSTEIVAKSYINLENLLSECNDDVLYVPNCYDDDGINDEVAIGNMTSMKRYFDCYTRLREILNEGYPMHTKNILKQYINKIGLNIIRFDFNYV